MIEINKDTNIYIVCPANATTGGPESLHQLCGKLIKKGWNAKMYYTPNSKENNTPAPYLKYNTCHTNKIEDNRNHILIVPETQTGFLYKFSKIRKIIWWLAVDFHIGKNIKLYTFKKRTGIYAMKRALKIQPKYTFERQKKLYHFYQSEYVRLFLEQNKVRNKYPLAAYLNLNTFKIEESDYNQKKNWVAYNPKKGFQFTKKIISQCDFEFKPIKDMTPQEVSAMLKACKVYIDFGYHPGRERLPKEAVLTGCCVITGKKGSAKNPIDVPILNQYKFDDFEGNIPQIIHQIQDCFNNYQENWKNFVAYQNTVLNEEKTMEESIDKIFRDESNRS